MQIDGEFGRVACSRRFLCFLGLSGPPAVRKIEKKRRPVMEFFPICRSY